MCQFVPNFRSYISAKYCLQWFTVGKVITEIRRVNFLMRHSVCIDEKRATELLYSHKPRYNIIHVASVADVRLSRALMRYIAQLAVE